jgi:hypothetical protein
MNFHGLRQAKTRNGPSRHPPYGATSGDLSADRHRPRKQTIRKLLVLFLTGYLSVISVRRFRKHPPCFWPITSCPPEKQAIRDKPPRACPIEKKGKTAGNKMDTVLHRAAK